MCPADQNSWETRARDIFKERLTLFGIGIPTTIALIVHIFFSDTGRCEETGHLCYTTSYIVFVCESCRSVVHLCL